MSVDDRLRRASAALDRGVQEVDVVQRLVQLKGHRRRQARTAAVVAVAVLLLVIGVVAVGLAIRQQPQEVVPVVQPVGAVAATITLPDSGGPLGVAYGHGSVWTMLAGPSDKAPGLVARIDPSNNRIIARVPVGKFPARAAAGAGAIWVTNHDDNTVSRINPDTNKVTATIRVGRGPFGIGSAGGAVWVANSATRTVSRIDPATNKVTTIQVGPFTSDFRGLAAGPNGIWVANTNNTISRIDPTTSRVVATLHIDNCCDSELAVGLGSVWLSNAKNGTVSRIDSATNTLVTTIKVGSTSPFGIGVGSGAVWVTASSDKTVWRIDPTTNQIVGKIQVTGENHSLATGAGAVWVQGLENNLVTRIDPNR